MTIKNLITALQSVQMADLNNASEGDLVTLCDLLSNTSYNALTVLGTSAQRDYKAPMTIISTLKNNGAKHQQDLLAMLADNVLLADLGIDNASAVALAADLAIDEYARVVVYRGDVAMLPQLFQWAPLAHEYSERMNSKASERGAWVVLDLHDYLQS